MKAKPPKIPMAALRDFYRIRAIVERMMAIYAMDVNNPSRFDRVKEQSEEAREICSKWINGNPPKDF